MAYAPSEDSDQPAHPRSLIRIYPRLSVDSQGSFVAWAVKALIRLRFPIEVNIQNLLSIAL